MQRLSIALLSLSICHAVWAQESDSQGAPINSFFQSDGVFSQDKGQWQVSTDVDLGRSHSSRSTETGLSLEYGITDNFQVSVEHMPYARYKDKTTGDISSGHGDTVLGMMKAWHNINDSPNSVSVAYARVFSTNNLDAVNSKDGNDLALTMAHDLKRDKSQQVTLQVGREFGGNEQLTYANLAAYRKLAAKQVVTSEVNWNQNETWLTPGMYWQLGKGFDAGVGVAVAAGGDAEGHKVLGRLNYEWD
jgi:hypothetical protein